MPSRPSCSACRLRWRDRTRRCAVCSCRRFEENWLQRTVAPRVGQGPVCAARTGQRFDDRTLARMAGLPHLEDASRREAIRGSADTPSGRPGHWTNSTLPMTCTCGWGRVARVATVCDRLPVVSSSPMATRMEPARRWQGRRMRRCRTAMISCRSGPCRPRGGGLPCRYPPAPGKNCRLGGTDYPRGRRRRGRCLGQVMKMSSGRNAETRKLGTSTSWLTLRSTATLQMAYAC